MIDFITQYHDVLLWFCFGVAGLVIPGLMGCDEYPGNESKLWKVRLVGLLIIFSCICYFFRNFSWDANGVFARILASVAFWLVCFFPRNYFWLLLTRDKGDNKKK